MYVPFVFWYVAWFSTQVQHFTSPFSHMCISECPNEKSITNGYMDGFAGQSPVPISVKESPLRKKKNILMLISFYI